MNGNIVIWSSWCLVENMINKTNYFQTTLQAYLNVQMNKEYNYDINQYTILNNFISNLK